jgi:hypothetical protein
MDISKMQEVQKDTNEHIKNVLELNKQLKQEMSNLRTQIKAKDEKLDELQKHVKTLEVKLESQEQYSRRNSLRLSGVPEEEGELVPNLVIETLNENLTLDPPLKLDELDRAHRVGPKVTGQSRPILIKFAAYGSKSRIYKKKKELKPDPNVGPFTTELFLNEDLTKTRVNLLYKTRQKKKEKKITDCWTYDGNIYIKDKVNKIYQIHSEADLPSE